MSVLMGFGPARFQIETHTFEQLDRQLAIRHVEVPVVSARPVVQFIGPGAETIDIRATVYPVALHRAGAQNIELLRNLALLGDAQMMVAGTGRVLGTFVITSVREGRSYFDPKGNSAKIALDLAFLYKPASSFSLANLGRLFG